MLFEGTASQRFSTQGPLPISTSESTENRADALKQIEEELRALNAPQKLLSELLPKAQEDAVAKATAKEILS